MKHDKLFKYFRGKCINFVMKNVKGAQVLGEGMVAEGNVIMSGYLLDEDDKFYYVGSSADEVDEALLKDDLVRLYLETDEEIVQIVEIDEGTGRH